MALVKAYRTHGHLAARLDPLGSEPVGDPALEPELLVPKLTPELQEQIPASVLRVGVEGETLADVLPKLREIYCGTIAYEIEHISDHQERVWLRQAIESGRYRQPLSAEERRLLLERLTEVEGFEHYLRRAFLGQKQFSIEGLDVMVPMLDEAIELGAEQGAHEVVIGMAHRGRLNVLAHIIGRPYEEILREFEGERTIEAIAGTPDGASGDVKYHLGAVGRRSTKAGEATVLLAANPSHLEAVDPVVEGITRAEQTDRSAPTGVQDPAVALPMLIHGDASFPGQGVVAETLNLQRLIGYTTGGTLHLIANNQVGFTTEPADGRSTRYSSDLAKGFDTPIIHVNADDPEAAISAIRLALAFRRRFGSDVVVDLVGYRRHGHNEGDEPSFTQPLMAERIANHPTVRALYAEQLVESGEISAEEAERLAKEVQDRMRAAHDALKSSLLRRQPRDGREHAGRRRSDGRDGRPGRAAARAHGGARPRARGLHRQPEAREDARAADRGARRGRHRLGPGRVARLREPARRGNPDPTHGPGHRAGHLLAPPPRPARRRDGSPARPDQAPLRCDRVVRGLQLAALGVRDPRLRVRVLRHGPEALVLWEAQFGDFVNGAQIIVDQFLVSGLAKWRQTSRLTLLLPHGYEGNGPEHSSARLERFLQLAAQENIRIVNATTSAQYFHLLRRQALDPNARPLVVMTPKGLLRLKEASSTLADLAEGRFEPVLDDPAPHREQVTRLVLSSGKLYYDIVGPRAALAGAARRGRPPRAALSVPGRGGRASSSPRTRARGGRLGAGGAAEHGRLAGDPAPARGGRRGASRSGTPAGRGARARARATRRRTRASRTGSSAKCSSPRLGPAPSPAAARAAIAIRGPCMRASAMIRRRCCGGIRRQMSYAVRASATAPVFRLSMRSSATAGS